MQLGFFDIDRRHAMLNAQGDPLERLNKVIDWGIFRFVLGRIDAKAHKSNAGRKPTDRVSMFKLLILQRIYNLAHKCLQFQIKDRLSFMRFPSLGLVGDIPDARWTKKAGVSHYGYKNRANVDSKLKLITKFSSTDANVRGSQELNGFLRGADEGGANIHADSAYRSDEAQNNLTSGGYDNRIHAGLLRLRT